MTVKHYEPRPQTARVSADRVTETNQAEVARWCGGMVSETGRVHVPNVYGPQYADPGDYVVHDLDDGHFFVLSVDDFDRIYIRPTRGEPTPIPLGDTGAQGVQGPPGVQIPFDSVSVERDLRMKRQAKALTDREDARRIMFGKPPMP